MTEEYLTIEELSARLKIKPKTIKNKIAAGVFGRSTHYPKRSEAAGNERLLSVKRLYARRRQP